jgi:hypothetical protein
LIAEYFTGSFRDAVTLNTAVRSSEIIAGKSFAALSSFSQPRSFKDFVLIGLLPVYLINLNNYLECLLKNDQITSLASKSLDVFPMILAGRYCIPPGHVCPPPSTT